MALKKLGVSLVVGANLGNKFVSVFDKAQKKTFKLGQAIKQTNDKLNASNAVVNYQKKLKSLQTFQGNLGQSSTKMKRQIAATSLALEEAKRNARGYGLSIGGIVTEQKKLSRESIRLTRNLERVKKASKARGRLGGLKAAGVGLLGLGLGGGNLIGGAFALEDKRNQLGDVITGKERGKRLAESVKSAREFARKSLASESDVLEINYSLRSSGLDDAAANFGATIVSKVAEVTKGSAGDVGFIIGDTFKNIGDSMIGTTEEKLARIGDVLTKTKNLFSIKDFNQLGEGLKEGLGAAIQNNITLEETAALIGQINNGMLKGSQAGTGLNALLRQLPKASKEIGFKIIRDKNGVLDTIATLKNLKKATEFITNPDEKALLIQKSFGDEGKKALIPLLNNLSELESNFKKVRDESTGTFDEGYQRRLKAASGQWKMLSQNMGMIGTTIATSLLPGLNALLTPLNSAAGWVGKMVERFPVLGKVLSVVATGVVGYGVLLGSTIAVQWAFNSAAVATSNSFIASTGSFVLSKAAMIGNTVATTGATAAQWLFNAALNANPIGLVIAGAVAFAGIAITVYKKWEPIKLFFADLWKSIKSTFDLVAKFGATVGSFFGGSEPQKKGSRRSRRNSAIVGAALSTPLVALPAAAAPAPLDTLPNIKPAAANTRATVNNQQQYTINVTQLPGESGEDLAQRITQLQQDKAMREEADVE